MNFPRERIARAFLSALALLPACITATATVAVSPCGTNNIDPTSGVLLTWAADAGALGYRLDINSDPFYSSGSNIHIESVFPPNVSVTVTGLQLSTQYYWHVATQGSDGNWGSYGTPCTFTTFGPQAVPILYSPAHEAVGLNTPALLFAAVIEVFCHQLNGLLPVLPSRGAANAKARADVTPAVPLGTHPDQMTLLNLKPLHPEHDLKHVLNVLR